jgi:hypothetical protein
MSRKEWENEDGSIDIGKVTRSMLTSRADWPGETVCVKQRRRVGGGYADFGVVASTSLPLTIYLRDDFARVQKYDSVDAMMADGWEID